jgi:hypothetical protein
LSGSAMTSSWKTAETVKAIRPVSPLDIFLRSAGK